MTSKKYTPRFLISLRRQGQIEIWKNSGQYYFLKLLCTLPNSLNYKEWVPQQIPRKIYQGVCCGNEGNSAGQSGVGGLARRRGGEPVVFL